MSKIDKLTNFHGKQELEEMKKTLVLKKSAINIAPKNMSNSS
jgi:hypothetical protein